MVSFNVQSVQYAWFVADTGNLSADALLLGLLGLTADSFQVNRVPSPQLPFLSSATRNEKLVSYTVTVSPGRVDLFIQAAASAASGDVPLLDVKIAFDALFNGLTRDGADALLGVYRFAVVCTFMDLYGSEKEASGAYFEKLGIPFINDAMDHHFVLNRRKEIEGFGGQMNRLVRYQLESKQKIQVLSPNTGAIDLSTGKVLEVRHFLKTTIDVNNVPIGDVVFSPVQLVHLVKAFCSEAIFLQAMRKISEL